MMKNLGVWATFAGAFATCLIALFAYKQLSFTEDTLHTFQNELRLTKKPEVILRGSDRPGSMFTLNESVDIKEGKKWQLPYYVENISDNPAYNLQYYHITNTKEEFPVPSIDMLSDFQKNNIIYSGQAYSCGFDVVYKLKYLDDIKAGLTYYRHFYIKYDDELNSTYSYSTTWELKYDPEVDSLSMMILNYVPIN